MVAVLCLLALLACPSTSTSSTNSNARTSQALSVRPPKSLNLAGNMHRQDVTAAEFIRTFMTQSFVGCALLRRSKSEAEAQLQERRQVSKVPVRRSSIRQQSSFSVPFEEVYGFRGRDASLYYLSPWEFT